MAELGWPRPPLVLGLVLGRLAENYLFLSTGRYGAAFLTRPIVLILLAIILAAVLAPLLQPWFSRLLARRLPLSQDRVEVFAADEP